MISPLFSYLLKNIFFAPGRQKILFLAALGISISAFALIILQSTMGGLQRNLIDRSKNVFGHAEIEFIKPVDNNFVSRFEKEFQGDFKSIPEVEYELLVKNDNKLLAAIIHGVDPQKRPSFLESFNLNGIIAPPTSFSRLGSYEGDDVQIISVAHTDLFFGDIPRSSTTFFSDEIYTMVPEVEQGHMWARDTLLQNLSRERGYNKIRIYSPAKPISQYRGQIESLIGERGVLRSWEEIHSTLVFALGLETKMMIFLFAVMSLLISLCITSGLLIFFGKLKSELASFWILGLNIKKIEKICAQFSFFLSFFSSFLGLSAGLLFLSVFDAFGMEVLPDIFVDRQIPVEVTLEGVLIAFGIPFLISLIFSFISFVLFKKEARFLEIIRGMS